MPDAISLKITQCALLKSANNIYIFISLHREYSCQPSKCVLIAAYIVPGVIVPPGCMLMSAYIVPCLIGLHSAGRISYHIPIYMQSAWSNQLGKCAL